MAPRKQPKTCQHTSIVVDASAYGRSRAGFLRVPVEKRVAATTRSGRVIPVADADAGTSNPDPNSNPGRSAGSGSGSDVPAPPDPSTFPGPLVLPDDDLALEPRYPPQSLRAWASGEWRNRITGGRKTLYVADFPGVEGEVGFMREWEVPVLEGGTADGLEQPKVEDVVSYFEAFYHPLPAKVLPTAFRFVKWDDEGVPRGKAKEKKTFMIGLATGSSVVGIRCRPSPDDFAKYQLNLNDLLDALSGVLPGDAYAACMLIAQDLYEDEDDDFCCGRAFGGSRICTVSSFRYRPAMDGVMGVERGHGWPASHCGRFVREACEWWEEQEEMERVREGGGGMEVDERGSKGKGKGKKEGGGEEVLVDLRKVKGTAMGAAISVSRNVLVPREVSRNKKQAEEDLYGMWFSRVARTAVHEVGHCLGMDHCVYYACVMQGTGGLGEDSRQPPYFCPVCEAKFIWGLGEMGVVEGGRGGRWMEGRMREVEKERMEVMRAFCERWKGVGMFAGFGGWLEARLKMEFGKRDEAEVSTRVSKEVREVEVIVIDSD
ncbi:hypothetical protein CTAM01_05017 [Colletotrichum tamarilloi]|uniref:Archaemetzincin-2 n=1 Tax=Colletotrichum tamarilloi TaxID=1209934 RepID=A0ABQ9RGW8_9PEZI|nr:uncharacterized protein CTAM01_05017 [Colletotrichum tamarilloi]KAK1503028.1 hypothetical protein CTAM01_05017 [Colletotrichum tamarilloi]